VTQQETYAGRAGSTYADQASGGAWITFAGVMVVMSAILNIIDGIAATRPLRAGGPRRASDVQLRGVR
jgi:hypothetical protein